MLLPICHDDAELFRIVLDRVLTPIHRAAVQDGDFRQVTVRVRGHDKESQTLGLTATESDPQRRERDPF